MSIHVKVPATTANLGPGFDALGLALDLWNEADFSFREDGQIKLTVLVEGANSLPTDAENLVARSALRLFDLAGEACPGLQIDCLNRIPRGSGLGSSSAAVLTGLLGANGLLGSPLSKERILDLAIEIEGHPDNVAPAMLGGLVVSLMNQDRSYSLQLPVSSNLSQIHTTVALPDFYYPTREARAALPKKVEHQDAVFNISRAILLTEALRTGNMELFGIAMEDKLHQPYRLPQIPGAIQALAAAKAAGASAAALSGGGPSLIAFSSRPNPEIGDAMQQAFQAAGLTSRIFELSPTQQGAQTRQP